jgi:hypothetical protein
VKTSKADGEEFTRYHSAFNCTGFSRNASKSEKLARAKTKNPKNKGKYFSHLFASIFYRPLVPRMNNSRLNYMVLIKINRIWKNKKKWKMER